MCKAKKELNKIFIICPVRNVTEGQLEDIKNYVEELDKHYIVHFPPRDTNQTDDGVGLGICRENRKAIEEADEIHIYWDVASKGSLFDLGMVFVLRKKLLLINKVNKTAKKSFSNILRAIEV